MPQGQFTAADVDTPAAPVGRFSASDIDQPEPAAAAPQGSALSRFASNFWEKGGNPVQNYKSLGTTLYNLVTDPKQTLTQIGDDQDIPRQRAAAAFEKGDWGQGLIHGLYWLANAIPGVGTALDDAGVQAAKGDVAGAAGATAGLVTQLETGRALPKAMEAAPRIANAAALAAKAGGPKVLGGAALAGAGAAASEEFPEALRWPARLGMAYPGVRMILQGMKEGAQAAKQAMAESAPATAGPGFAQSAFEPAESDTALLDQLARGYKYQSFAKAPPDVQATITTLAARVNGAPPPEAAPAGPYTPRPLDYYLTESEKAARAQAAAAPAPATPNAPASPAIPPARQLPPASQIQTGPITPQEIPNPPPASIAPPAANAPAAAVMPPAAPAPTNASAADVLAQTYKNVLQRKAAESEAAAAAPGVRAPVVPIRTQTAVGPEGATPPAAETPETEGVHPAHLANRLVVAQKVSDFMHAGVVNGQQVPGWTTDAQIPYTIAKKMNPAQWESGGSGPRL